MLVDWSGIGKCKVSTGIMNFIDGIHNGKNNKPWGLWAKLVQVQCIMNFIDEIHNGKNNRPWGLWAFILQKNDTLSRSIGVILFFFEVEFMHVFVIYCLGHSKKQFCRHFMAHLALNISRDKDIGIWPQFSENESTDCDRISTCTKCTMQC